MSLQDLAFLGMIVLVLISGISNYSIIFKYNNLKEENVLLKEKLKKFEKYFPNSPDPKDMSFQ